jgi:signal transduction histidine kinase
MPKASCADQLARECVRERWELRRACQVLHDEVGSLLAVSGLRLQLLRMDFAEVDSRAAEVAEALDAVMERVRVLSRELEPSPVRRTGLKNALLDLAESYIESFAGMITVRYTATAVIPTEIADALYHATASAVVFAVRARGAARVNISVSGGKGVVVRVAGDGRAGRPGAELAAAALLAQHAGLSFDVKTEKGTIVSIRYAGRRPTGG